MMNILKEILKEYQVDGYSEELGEKFKDAVCPQSCDGCPVDVQVRNHIVCDHLIHGERVSYW